MIKYFQGKFIPKNPKKYVGDYSNIVARSSWEFKLFKWLDENISITKWASEELIIPYFDPVSNKIRRYFPDVLVEYISTNGSIKRAVIEVKPDAQTRMPILKRKTKRYLTESSTYITNTAKWEAAKKWCDSNGFDFWIFTEYELGIKKRK